jgi:hypothetical protein
MVNTRKRTWRREGGYSASESTRRTISPTLTTSGMGDN